RPQVARVDAYAAKFNASNFNGVVDALGDVESIDQQGRAHAMRVHLGLEGSLLIRGAIGVNVLLSPRWRRSAGCRYAVACSGCQVGREVETRKVGSSSRARGRLLMGAPRAYFNDGASISRGHRARGRRGDRGVGVHDG